MIDLGVACLDAVGRTAPPLFVGVAAVLILCETALVVGLVLPGLSALLALGFAISTGLVHPGLGYPAAVGAAMAGGQIAYRLGRRAGFARLLARVRRRAPGEAAVDLVDRGPRTAVVAGQWIVGVRTFVPRIAGAQGMPYRVFTACQLTSAGVWATTGTTVGLLAGELYQRVGMAVTVAGVAVIVLLAVFVAGSRRSRVSEVDTAGADESDRPCDARTEAESGTRVGESDTPCATRYTR